MDEYIRHILGMIGEKKTKLSEIAFIFLWFEKWREKWQGEIQELLNFIELQ